MTEPRQHLLPVREPTVLSLFAGVGGIDLGLEALGCRTVAYSEVDPYACRVMAMRFPDAVNLGDITQIDWSELDAPDIIAGGFPCQDISLAGKGAGIDGDRSGLWRHYADAIRHLRPRGVLVENVAALASRGLDRVLGDLAACGYDAEWDCIPAAAVGAPHLRDRILLVAYPGCERPQVPAGGRLAAVAQPRSDGPAGRAHEPRPADNAMCGRHGTPARQVRAGWDRPIRTSWWTAEPDVGRVADGVPKRVDRLRCLGNAVVPAVAEHVGRILLDRMEVPA